MSSLPKYPNYLTAQNGCSVTYQSSQRQRGPASSILTSNPNSVWVTNENVPQQCVISVKGIIKKPSIFNFIGFYCWHQYDSNPALIEVWVRGQKSKQWQILTKVRLNMLDVWQYFKIDEIAIDRIKEVKLRIMQNFGDSKTYLNKVGLFSLTPSMMNKESQQQQLNHIQISNRQKINPSIPTVRDKTYSEYNASHPQSINLTVTNLQKQLQKANENIAELSSEQQYMKKTIIKQEQVIIQIQQKFKAILDNIEKMRIIQSGYNVTQLQSSDQEHRNIGRSLNMKKKKNIKKVEINEEAQEIDKNYKKKETKKLSEEQKRIDIENLKNQLYLMEKNSINKKKTSEQSSLKPSKSSGYKRSPHYQNSIARSSDNELTEYVQPNYKTSQSQHQNNILGNSLGGSKGDKAKMLQRLKKLIELKEMKKIELKRSSAAKGIELHSRAKRDNIYQQDGGDDNGSEDDQYS